LIIPGGFDKEYGIELMVGLYLTLVHVGRHLGHAVLFMAMSSAKKNEIKNINTNVKRMFVKNILSTYYVTSDSFKTSFVNRFA